MPSLRSVAERHELVGVVTQPDRPAGRGRHLRPSAVRSAAEQLGVPVLQPERPRGEEFQAELAALGAELSVVAAYGQLLVDEVLALPARGSINVHASLLPELRGAAPINWSIIRGHDRTGVTIMRIVRQLDAGPILHQVEEPLGERMTAGELSERLAALGAKALEETLERLAAGECEEREQDHERTTYAPKLSREAARLDWSLPAEEVDRWIRGCDPWPAAWSELDGRPVQFFDPTVLPASGSPEPPAAPPGRVLDADPRTGVTVAAGRGAVRIGAVKPAGRSRMGSADWIRGRGARAGDRFR
ncbi:MAG: methionyl-tRNA formyltransferase [Gemmatimonadota bacterium]